MIVAIDGPAGSGKSTVARAVAAQRGFTFLDTGAMYRAVALKCLRDHTDLNDTDAVIAQAKASTIVFAPKEGGAPGVFLNDEDVTATIRTAEVDASVSAIAAIAGVREAMVARQRELAGNLDVVAEGRDIGTVVFPQAEVKVFLTASAEARAHRRAVERAGANAATDPSAQANASEEASILASIKARDEADSTRAAAPLRAAEDAVHIDSSNLTLDQVVSRVVELVDKARESEASQGDATDGKAAQDPEPQPAVAPLQKPREERSPQPRAQKQAAQNQGPMPLFGNSLGDFYTHGMREFPLTSRAFHHFIFAAVTLLSKIYFRWTVEDSDKLVSAMKEGGCVVVMNHCSAIDPAFPLLHAWLHGCRLRPIYKSEFDKHKLLSWFFSRIGGIPVDRGTADMKMVRACRAALKRGESILVFPQGTRVRSDDEQVEIHGGFALIAQMAKGKVAPMAIVGARNIKPAGTFFPRPTKVILKAAEAISFSSLGVRGRKEQLSAMETKAMDEVWRLRDELRCDHPGRL